MGRNVGELVMQTLNNPFVGLTKRLNILNTTTHGLTISLLGFAYY
jgi:hypothetical protein